MCSSISRAASSWLTSAWRALSSRCRATPTRWSRCGTARPSSCSGSKSTRRRWTCGAWAASWPSSLRAAPSSRATRRSTSSSRSSASSAPPTRPPGPGSPPSPTTSPSSRGGPAPPSPRRRPGLAPWRATCSRSSWCTSLPAASRRTARSCTLTSTTCATSSTAARCCPSRTARATCRRHQRPLRARSLGRRAPTCRARRRRSRTTSRRGRVKR
mmetsp:Transcript_30581/g.52330  ORF Transcript_30581/g.52330 Transcript_30581/m.52330 type:complete len:214 (-) Transcript_30581:90-731(-)